MVTVAVNDPVLLQLDPEKSCTARNNRVAPEGITKYFVASPLVAPRPMKKGCCKSGFNVTISRADPLKSTPGGAVPPFGSSGPRNTAMSDPCGARMLLMPKDRFVD